MIEDKDNIKNKNEENENDSKDIELKSIKGEKEINVLRLQLEEFQFKNLSLLADMENLKKRLNDEKFEIYKYSTLPFFQEMIPTFTMFETALEAKNISDEIKNWLIGFKMIQKNFHTIFEGAGVKKINAKIGQEFNSNLHDAIEVRYSNNIKKDKIIDIKQDGYLLFDRLIRPTSVVVSKGKEEKG